MRHLSRIRLFEEKEVFVIDKDSPLYGRKFVVDFFLSDGTPSFRDLTTGTAIELGIDQISEHPPEETQRDTFK